MKAIRSDLHEKISGVLVLLILTVTALLFSNRMMYAFHIPKYLFVQFTVFLFLTVYLFRQQFQISLNRLDLLIIFRPIYLLLLFFVSANYATVFENIDILLYLTLFYLLLRQFLSQPDMAGSSRCLNGLICGIVVVSILESGYGILQYFELDPFHPGGYHSYESNVIGTFGSENAMGGFLAAGFPLAFYQLYAGNKGLKKYLIAVGTGLMLVALALTISREAWIAVIIAALFLAFPGIKRIAGSIDLNKILKIGIVILILIVGFLLLLEAYNINAAFSSGRIFIWKISLGMLAENPLIGIGYGNYGY